MGKSLVPVVAMLLGSTTACTAPDASGNVANQAVQASTPRVAAGDADDIIVLPGGATIRVKLDPAQVAIQAPRDVRVIAERGNLVALSDSYSSKSRGAGLCQAGNETWFRVIDVAARAERYARLVDSCVGDQQWGDPPVTVEGAKITLNLLSEAPVTLVLGANGMVTASR